MSNALMRRLASLLVLSALVFSGFVVATSAARADAPAVPDPSAADSSTSVTHSRDSLTPTTAAGDSRLRLALDKMDPSLQPVAQSRQKGYSDVMIYTTNMPQLGQALQAAGARIAYTVDDQTRVQRFVARPWGAAGQMVSIYVQVPNPALLGIAGLDGVAYLQQRDVYAPAIIRDEVTSEEHAQFESVRSQIRDGNFKLPPEITSDKSKGSVSPTSWAIAREHKALDVWRDLGYDGSGVNVAVIDTGEDFGHPSLQGQWAIDTNPGSEYFGWPVMFHPASMEGLFGQGFWTVGSDIDRLPLPYWLSVNDGDVWYSNTDYRANDSNLDGFLVYNNALTPDPVTGLRQYTPQRNPQQYGNWGANFNTRINRNYWIGAPGDPDQIISASGLYRLGVNRDDSLTGLWGEKVGILLVDSVVPEMYDTVYVDLNFNFDFTDDTPVTRANPLAVADLTGDGVSDVSGGLLYFIASSSRVTGEVVIASITGTQTGAALANRGVAVDVTGLRMFEPIALTLESGPTSLYLPGMTEDIIEEFSMGAGDETNTVWSLGSAQTVFGPVTVDLGDLLGLSGFDGRAVDSARLLRGPNTDFSIGLIYDISNSTTTLAAGTDYSINLATGEITWLHNFPAGDFVDIIYQLDSYTLNAGAGTVTFNAPLPTGWRLLATYDDGVPIPYSDIYAANHGLDLFVPANGDLVAFHGDFDFGQSHGSFVSSTIAARPFGNLASPFFEVFGTAPGAKIMGIAACCNVAGPIGLFGSIEDQRDFAAVGYDGITNGFDDASIISNSFGSTQTVNTGFSFEDRWLYDFAQRNPTVTTLIAFGNNGAGYATGAPGGTSPGVITIGAGTSGDYRVLFGFDGGEGNYEFPLCPGPPPIDPATCVGIGAASGDGPGPYGDHAYFSSRGPTLLGQPKPDVVSIGSFAVEAAPLNLYCTNPGTGLDDPAWCDGNFAFDIFSGTSQATPVTSGIAALGIAAYRDTHGGAFPTNTQVRAALKAGADDMHRDILQQGAGWTNALRSTRIMAELDGITSSPSSWIPGSYQGIKRPAFVNLLAAGANDATTITVTNHHPTLAKNVQVSDAVMQRMPNGAFSWAVSVGTGTGRNYILKADGIYAGDGATLLMAEPWTAQWNTADFTKITWTYDSAAYTAPTSLRLDVFDWYDNQHPTFELVAESTLTTYTNQTIMIGVNGETKAKVFNPGTTGFACSQAGVDLRSATGFAVLGGASVTNTGPTIVTGDLGVSPGTSITGFPPGTVIGTIHNNNPIAAQAIADLTTAYNDAAGRTLCPITVAGNIGGQTLAPGLYKSTSSLAVSSGDLTLDAQGDPNAVWIFQVASTLDTTPGRQVILAGGAQASNVYWQVGTSATIGTTSAFVGTIMADQSVTLNTGATLEGRALARIAAASLDSNIINQPGPGTGGTGTPHNFYRDSVGLMTDISPGPCPLIPDPTLYWINVATGEIILCAPLLDGERLYGDYTVYVLIRAGDSVFLSHTGIVPGSETVFLNGNVWAPSNYVINYATGEFTFLTGLALGDVVEISYLWDHPQIYDGFDERNRMTVAVFGGNANSVHESFGRLPTKMHDGLVLNIRSGAAAAIPATLIVEFYQKADWTWLTESAGSLNIPAAGGTSPVTVTATVPAGAQPGLYEGAVYLTDAGTTTTIPVVINVPVTGFPVNLGGNVPSTSLYDNNGVIQGARSGWRQIGDSRYVWADLSLASVPGRRMIYNAILQGRLSDPDMLVFSCIPDPDGYTADATYGPCRMSQLAATKENVGVTDTLFPNKEFMHSDVVSGLIAFQLKAFGSRGTYANGAEPLVANIGIMQATMSGPGNPLGPTEVSTATNRLTGSVPLVVWANVPLYNGLGAAVTEQVSVVCAANLPVTPYPYPGGDFETYLFNAPNKARCDVTANTISVTWVAQFFNGADIDYGIFQDLNCDGVYTVANSFAGTSMATGANPETFSAGFPPPGCYWVHAAGFDATGSTTTTITMNVNRIGVSPFALVNPPTTDVAPNTPIQTGIGWTFPPNQAQVVVSGLLFVSPGYAPFALAQGLTLSVRYDTTPVTIQDFAPAPGSTVRDPRASIVANVYDTAVQMINIDSARLWVDGAEVTQVMRKLPTFASAVSCCYNLLTVAYDPQTDMVDGPHSATLEVSDIAGNVARATWSWTVDASGSKLTLTSPAGDGVVSRPALVVSGMAPGAVSVTVNGVAVTVDSVTGAFSTVVILTPGPNTIDVIATDAAGNTARVTRTIIFDTSGPTLLNVRSSEPSKTNKDTTVISGTAGEAVSRLTVAGLAVPVRADGSFSIRMPLVEGVNTFDVVASDLAGNRNTVSVVVTRDTVAPAFTVAPITPSIITDLSRTTVNVTGTVNLVTSPDVSLVTVNGIAVAVDPVTGAFRRQFSLSLGSNVFVVEAQDDVGNRRTATTSVTYSPVVETIQRSYTSYILGSVALILLVIGFVVGWLLRGGRPPRDVVMVAPAGTVVETRAPEPEEIPAEEEMTTEEEEL